MKPHKHAALIKAWADGAQIQYLAYNGEWCDASDNAPEWNLDGEYRIKPEKDYPKSTLSYQHLCNIWDAAHKVKSNEGIPTIALRMCADAAVAQYIRESEE